MTYIEEGYWTRFASSAPHLIAINARICMCGVAFYQLIENSVRHTTCIVNTTFFLCGDKTKLNKEQDTWRWLSGFVENQ